MTLLRPPALDTQKRALLEAQLKREGMDVSGPRAIARRAVREQAPLSFAQQRLWFLNRLDPSSTAYNVPLSVPFRGALQVSALERTLNEVIRRHDILRTHFELDRGEPVQRIAERATVGLKRVDLSTQPATHHRETMRRLVGAEIAHGFDLTQGPLMRCTLVRLAPDDHLLLLTLHHVVTDAWSMDVLAREMTIAYAAYSAGRNPTLPDLPIQYGDYAAWQREYLRGPQLEAELLYWRTQLEDAAMLELPTDRARPPVMSSRGATCRAVIPAAVGQPLRTLAHAENATLFMTLLAVFKTLLHRYSGQNDIVVGAPIAGRAHPDLAPLIGFFVNSLVMRTSFAGNPPFREVLRRVRTTAVGAFSHQELPFEKLVEELKPQRDLSRNPYFQVIFQMLRGEADNGAAHDAVDDAGEISSKFDLSFTIQDQGEALMAFVEYNADLYDSDSIEQLCAHYVNLARTLAAVPDTRVGDAAMLLPDETRRLRRDDSAGATRTSDELCLHTLIECTAAAHPAATAVQSETESIGFAELEARANRLARRLRLRGIGPDRIVGIHLERSVDMVVAIYATLKAGGAYLPLDPDYPVERLRYMLADSGASAVITQAGLAPVTAPGTNVIELQAEREALAGESDAPLPCAVDPGHLAYVIYTSGSTGRPKGVMVPHQAICNHMQWMVSRFALTTNDAVLQKTPISFDASVWEIFAPLIAGGRLVLARQGGHRDAAYLIRAITSNSVSVLQLVPSQLGLMLKEDTLEDCRTLRLVLCGGEPLGADLCVGLAQRLGVELHNIYGPTEVTIDATSWHCQAVGRADRIPIGKPIDNIHAYVLDDYGNPVSRGVPGTLYLGGAGLARGYLGRPRLTAERFVPDALSGIAGARLYCTGDRVRWRRDGTLDFLGRVDEQIKLRGYRIEPAELARALESHPQVQHALAMARGRVGEEPKLCAFFVPAPLATCQESELRAHLRNLLPDYMMPASITPLPELPRTPHGKIDWQALPEPDVSKPRMPGVSTASSMEQKLAALWADVLELPSVGIDDNFFDLGGHSLLMAQLQHRLRGDLAVDVPLLDLFRYPTVRLLATHIAGRHTPRIPDAAISGNVRMTESPAPRRPSMHSRPMFRRPT